jgi:Protein of unknown function (DUF2949)
LSTTELTPLSQLESEIVEQILPEELVPTLTNADQNLIYFLRKDLSITDESIAIALRYAQQDRGPLPMILWRYGFVSLNQLNQIFDWLSQ